MSLHGTDNAAMRYTLGPIGVLVAVVLLGVSCTMNYRFGVSLGKSEFDGYVYGVASIGADVFKAIAPFFFFAALRSRAGAVAIAAFLVWGVTTGYALIGALGHSLLNRVETAGARSIAQEQHKDLRSDKKRYEQQLSWLPPHRDAGTVQAEIDSAKAKNLNLWNWSSECTEPNGKGQREYCAAHQKLNAELASAKSAADLNSKIESVSSKLSTSTSASATGETDPLAGPMSKALDIDLSKVQVALALLVVALIEFGSGLGPYVAISYMFAFGQSRSKIIDADYTSVASAPLRSDPAPGLPPPGQPPTAQAIPEASPAVIEPQPVINARKPIPGALPALAEINFQVSSRPAQRRGKSQPREAAERFLVWLRAHDLVNQELDDDDMTRFYAEFCEADNREPTAANLLRGELKNLRGVDYYKPRSAGIGGKVLRQGRYQIKPGKYPKIEQPAPAPPPEPAQPPPKQEGGRLLAFARRPLAVAPERAPIRITTHRSAA